MTAQNTTALTMPLAGIKSTTLQGIAWKVLSVFCFVLINTTVKYLTNTSYFPEPLHVNVISFYQNLFGLLIMFPIILKMGNTKVHFGDYKLWHSLRIIGATVGMWFWYLSVSRLPMAQCVALNFLGPIFTVIGARFVLGERLNFMRIVAISVSFGGAFVVLLPKMQGWADGLFEWVVLFPLFAAIGLGVNKISTRKLSATGIKAEVLTALIIIFSVPGFLIIAAPYWSNPSWNEVPWLMFIGAVTALAHYSLSRAYFVADAIFLAPFGFLKFLFSVIIAYLLFSEFPTELTLWLGTFVILTGLTILTVSQRGKSMALVK